MTTGRRSSLAPLLLVLVFPASITVSQARDQARIGSWLFELGDITPGSEIYFITSSTGSDGDGTFSLIDFACDQDAYKFQLLPAPNRQSGRNDLPDGAWTLQLSVNNGPPAVLTGRSVGGMITAPVSKKLLQALRTAAPRTPAADVITAMIEKTDGGRIQRAANYPATRFRAAMAILEEACRADE